MSGFLSGSLVLIALWVLVQEGTSSKVEDASGLSLRMLRRAVSPDVAGLPDRARRRAGATSPAPAPGGSGGSGRFLPLVGYGTLGGARNA